MVGYENLLKWFTASGGSGTE